MKKKKRARANVENRSPIEIIHCFSFWENRWKKWQITGVKIAIYLSLIIPMYHSRVSKPRLTTVRNFAIVFNFFLSPLKLKHQQNLVHLYLEIKFLFLRLMSVQLNNVQDKYETKPFIWKPLKQIKPDKHISI